MTSLHTLALVPLIDGLKNTAGFVQKAINHAKTNNIDPATYTTARLHPDMRDFCSQIYFLTDIAKGIPSRVNQNITALTLPDVETTFPELLARLKKTVEYLEAVKPEDINGREEEEVNYGPEGKFKSAVLKYVASFAHPNFWFHSVTAYGILRKQGVDLGKLSSCTALLGIFTYTYMMIRQG